MKIIEGGVTLSAGVATEIPMPTDVTRKRRWQLYISAASGVFEVLDSDQKTGGLPVPIVTGASGAFAAEIYSPGSRLWFYSTGTPSITYVWQEVPA